MNSTVLATTISVVGGIAYLLVKQRIKKRGIIEQKKNRIEENRRAQENENYSEKKLAYTELESLLDPISKFSRNRTYEVLNTCLTEVDRWYSKHGLKTFAYMDIDKQIKELKMILMDATDSKESTASVPNNIWNEIQPKKDALVSKLRSKLHGD